MDFAQEVIELKPFTEQFSAIRERALAGEPSALKKYVYYCVLNEIRSDNSIPAHKKIKTFLDIVKEDVIEVKFGQ